MQNNSQNTNTSKRNFLKNLLMSLAFFSVGGLGSILTSNPKPSSNSYGGRPYGV